MVKRSLEFPLAMMEADYMSCVVLSSKQPKNISARIIQAWMMRHRLGSFILTHWPFCLNTAVKELPEHYFWPPKKGLEKWDFHVLVFLLIMKTPTVKHSTLPLVSDMLEINNGEVIL